MVKILIAGDFVPRARVQALIDEGKYKEVFSDILPCISDSDYSVINLEAPIVVSPSAEPIQKCGPNIKSSPLAIKALRDVGFNMVTLANNHFFDYGENGVRDTLHSCDAEGMDYVGGGVDLKQAGNIFYKKIRDYKLAIINCCESEFSIAETGKGGANPINPVRQYYSIQEAKRNADYVIVIAHGGPENYQYPTPRMKELYRYFVDSGADVVVNHHQHCYSGYEIYNGKPIFYGLGNFCFDYANKNKSKWNDGYVVQLILDESATTFELIPYVQGFDVPGVRLMTDDEKRIFHDFILECNQLIQDDLNLERKYREFCEGSEGMYLVTLEPYSNKYFRAARFRKFIPSFLSKKRACNVLNYIMCESHRERFQYALNKRCK